MSKTQNYDIPYLTPNQTQREDVYNQGMNIIDSKIKELAMETGEIRKFLKKNIPDGWYEIKDYKKRLDDQTFFIENFDFNSSIHSMGTMYGEIFKTSSGLCIHSDSSTSSTRSYIYTNKTGLVKNNFFISHSGYDDSNIRFFNKEGSNIVYKLSMGYPSFSFNLTKYDLDNDTIIDDSSYSFDALGFTWGSTRTGRQNGFISIDKNHENIYIIHPDDNNGIFIVKFNIQNETIDTAYYPVITDEITNFELGVWNNRHVGLIYFNYAGNIVLSCSQSSGNPEAIQINKDTLGISRYTNNALIPDDRRKTFFSQYNKFSSHYIIWYGDDQILSGMGLIVYDEIFCIKNYTQIVSCDELWGVDFINDLYSNSGNIIAFSIFNDLLTDTEYNIFFRDHGSNLLGFLNTNYRLDGSERFEDNKVVECVYGVPQ